MLVIIMLSLVWCKTTFLYDLCLIESSADILCKKFGPRSGQKKRHPDLNRNYILHSDSIP